MYYSTSPINASQFSPAIIVNNITISKFEVNERRKLLIALGTSRSSAKRLAQENLINESLQKLHASTINIKVGETELEEVFNTFLKIRNLTKSDLKKTLKKFGASIEELKTYLKANVLMRNIISRTYHSRMTIDDFDLSLFRPTASTTIPTQINLSEIIIPFSIRGKDNTIKLANRIRNDLLKGKDFEQLAKRFSQAGTAQKGGLIGFLPINSVPAELRKILLTLKSGSISNAIITVDTVMIFRVNSWKNSEKSMNLPSEVSYILTENDDLLTSCEETENDKLKGPIQVSALEKSFKEKIRLLRPSEEIIFVDKDGLEKRLILCDKRIVLSENEIKTLKGQLLEKRLSKLAEGLNLELKRTANVTVLK
ncbi:MAG: peptidylprolyl isomerase [Paracoccaceae bacterium]